MQKIIKQDAQFVYYADGKKETLDEYRIRLGKPTRAEERENKFQEYRKINKMLLESKHRWLEKTGNINQPLDDLAG